ncbi:MAG: hypothetical protein R2706_11375 [Acidimicrobiales bacterium]
MTTLLGAPEAFFEIERAHAAFEVFELASAQIGSGRPEGPRSQLWGSIVVLSRASLEEALRRIHLHLCTDGACKYTKPQLDPAKFKLFLADHNVELPSSIPQQLHVALRQKTAAKAGHGTGNVVNGPLRSGEILDLPRRPQPHPGTDSPIETQRRPRRFRRMDRACCGSRRERNRVDGAETPRILGDAFVTRSSASPFSLAGAPKQP